MHDLIAYAAAKRFEVGQQVRPTPLGFRGIGAPDEVEIEVDRQTRHVEMEQVQRRAPAEREFFAAIGNDLAKQVREPEDSLERLGAKAGLVRHAPEVAPVGKPAHGAS